MQAIADFLKGIGEVLLFIADFIIDFFSDIVYLVKMLGMILDQLPVYLSWLPSELLSIMVAIFVLVVLYKVLGREG